IAVLAAAHSPVDPGREPGRNRGRICRLEDELCGTVVLQAAATPGMGPTPGRALVPPAPCILVERCGRVLFSLTGDPRSTIELDILVRGGVGDRLDVREKRRVRNQRADARLDLLRKVMSTLDRPRVGHQQVERNEAARAGLARAQRVERDAVARRIFGKELADLLLLV